MQVKLRCVSQYRFEPVKTVCSRHGEPFKKCFTSIKVVAVLSANRSPVASAEYSVGDTLSAEADRVNEVKNFIQERHSYLRKQKIGQFWKTSSQRTFCKSFFWQIAVYPRLFGCHYRNLKKRANCIVFLQRQRKRFVSTAWDSEIDRLTSFDASLFDLNHRKTRSTDPVWSIWSVMSAGQFHCPKL